MQTGERRQARHICTVCLVRSYVCFAYVRRNACNMHVYISTYLYPYIHVSVYMRMYVCMYLYVYVYICVYMRIYIYMYVCIYAYRHSSVPARRTRVIDTAALVSGRFLDD